MGKNKFNGFMPVVLLFIAINVLFVTGRHLFEKWNVDLNVALVGNIILVFITLFSFLLAKRGLNNSNPHAFVRSVYSSVMLKLFVCLIAAFVYISIYKSNLNKPALFICMGLYLVYTFLEVSILMKMLKQKKNA
jgi:hypothetical protein